MKRIVMLLALMTSLLAVQAADYTYLTFETTDGAKTSVNVSSLSLTISGTTLTAGTQSFTLTNLSKMYFSTADETTTTGIEAITAVTLDEAAEIYDLQGRKVQKSALQKGMAYIVKTKTGARLCRFTK